MNCWLNLFNFLLNRIHKDQKYFKIILKNYFATIFYLIGKHFLDLASMMNSEKI